MTCSRQQLLWQKQVTIIGSVDLDSQVNEYHWRSPISTCCPPQLLCAKRAFCTDVFFVAPDAYSRSFSEFFRVANSVLSLKRIKITWFSNCFEQKSLAWWFLSISCPAGVFLNTSNQDHGEKNDLYDPRLCYLMFKLSVYYVQFLCTPGLPLLCFQSMRFL